MLRGGGINFAWRVVNLNGSKTPESPFFFGAPKRYFPDFPFWGSVGGRRVRNPNLLMKGPNATTSIFEFISRSPMSQFWGTPECLINSPFYTEEHRETAKIVHLLCHQLHDVMCQQMIVILEKLWLWLWFNAPWADPDKLLILGPNFIQPHPPPPLKVGFQR